MLDSVRFLLGDLIIIEPCVYLTVYITISFFGQAAVIYFPGQATITGAQVSSSLI